jgi:DNA-binding CsgD family transcriptional regulator/PAS domain-containing protein
VGELAQSYFRDGWSQREERFRGVGTMMRRGAFGDLDFMDLDEISTNTYYQEFLGAHGFRWFAGIKIAFGDDLWVLAIQRRINQGPFTPAEIDELAGLSPRLSSAGAFAHALGFARIDAAMSAFETTGSAVILLDRSGEVVRVNSAAERLLGPHFQILQKRLLCSTADETNKLNAALLKILWFQQLASSPVQISRGERRPLIAHAVRLSGVSVDALAPCQAAVILIDLESQAQPPETLLRTCFGLTAAEAKLARYLASGRTLETVAQELGIARETARYQLKAVFAKTGVHRQPELVRILAQLVYQAPFQTNHTG